MKSFICLLFVTQFASAQFDSKQFNSDKFKLNKPAITIPFAFFSGVCDGVSQTIYSHYGQFEQTFPHSNAQFWNPAISWENKYKGGDPAQGERFLGSTTVFVFTTDAYHLFRTLNKTNLITLGALEFSEKRSWKQYIIDFALYSVIYSAGFTLTYNVVFH